MTSDPQQSDTDAFAVVLLVESSLTVALSWRICVQEYVTPLIRRLIDSTNGLQTKVGCQLVHGITRRSCNQKLRIGFISYGAADTVPSPIICRHFFNESSAVLLTIREDFTRFGLMHPASTGKRGMAALDGLVASLEVRSCPSSLSLYPHPIQLFDMYNGAVPNSTPHKVKSHLIHIAASSPDSSELPSWNDNPSLDSVSWSTLPAEFKKARLEPSICVFTNIKQRDIHLNFVGLAQDIGRIPALYSAVSLLLRTYPCIVDTLSTGCDLQNRPMVPGQSISPTSS